MVHRSVVLPVLGSCGVTLLILLAWGCSRRAGSEATAPGPALASTSETSVAVAPVPSSSAPNAGVAAGPGGTPGRVRCGDETCRAGAETCCKFGDVARCSRSVPDRPEDEGQPLAAQIQACESETEAKFALERLSRCDDSSDCGAGEMCCVMWLYSGASRQTCQPAPADGTSACDYGELCNVGQTCRTRGSECRGDRCRLPDVRLRCGEVTCPAAAPACCGADTPTCHAERDCRETYPQYECSGPSDCAPGEYCQVGIMGSFCQGMLDGANMRVVCQIVADCPRETCWEGGQNLACVADGWLSVCQCE